jgi:hypothetical protein
MNSNIVIYHRADFDGIFCREIANKFLPNTTLIGWDYGDPTPEVPQDATLYMLDISVEGLMSHPNLVWIDHHRSAMEKYDQPGKSTISGYRIDGVAACRLAWQWFTLAAKSWKEGDGAKPANPDRGFYVLPSDVQFKNREVHEPLAVRLAGEYDIWDKRDPDAELFQHGLRSEPLDDVDWSVLLSDSAWHPGGYNIVIRLLGNGKVLQYAKTQENASIIKDIGFTFIFEGLVFLACNHARYNSFLFTAGLRPEHDACFGFKWTGKDWSVSLYHAPGKEHHDLSLIAVKYNGGGHAGACGYRTKNLPFLAAT